MLITFSCIDGRVSFNKKKVTLFFKTIDNLVNLTISRDDEPIPLTGLAITMDEITTIMEYCKRYFKIEETPKGTFCMGDRFVCHIRPSEREKIIMDYLDIQIDFSIHYEKICEHYASVENYPMLRYAVEQGCPIGEAPTIVISHGKLDWLHYLYKNGCTMSYSCFDKAIEKEDVKICEYLYEKNFPLDYYPETKNEAINKIIIASKERTCRLIQAQGHTGLIYQ